MSSRSHSTVHAHALTDLQIARLVGAQAYTRGERFASHGHVDRTTWSASGTRVFATIAGSGAHSYVASVSFQASARGVLSDPVGSCTCPVAINCKHVAALLIATRGDAATNASPADGSASGVRFTADAEANPDANAEANPDADANARSVPSAGWATVEPPTFPISPARRPRSWQSALDPLTRHGAPAPTGSPLALQLELAAPRRNWRQPTDSSAPPRLAARPVTMGKRGKWIKGNLSWHGLSYGSGFNRAHQAALTAISEQQSAGRTFDYYAEEWIYLDAFTGDSLWQLLVRARELGVAIVTSDADQSPVTLASIPAQLSMDLSRTVDGLALNPSFMLDGAQLDPHQLILLGDPARVVATWSAPAPPAVSRSTSSTREWAQASQASRKRAPASPSIMPRAFNLTLAALSAPVEPSIRDLAATATPLFIPAADEQLFHTSYYPFLREQATLTSSDESFEIAAAPRPRLALTVANEPGPRVTLN